MVLAVLVRGALIQTATPVWNWEFANAAIYMIWLHLPSKTNRKIPNK